MRHNSESQFMKTLIQSGLSGSDPSIVSLFFAFIIINEDGQERLQKRPDPTFTFPIQCLFFVFTLFPSRWAGIFCLLVNVQ